MVWHYMKLAWYWMFPVKDELCELAILKTKPKSVREARCESRKAERLRIRKRPKRQKLLWLED